MYVALDATTKQHTVNGVKPEKLPSFFKVNDQVVQAMMAEHRKNGQRIYKLQNASDMRLKESQIGEVDENTLFKVLQYEDCDVPIQEAMRRDEINLEAFESARTVIGVSPTSSFNYNKNQEDDEDGDDSGAEEAFTSGKYLTEEEEKPQIFKHCTKHMPEWA